MLIKQTIPLSVYLDRMACYGFWSQPSIFSNLLGYSQQSQLKSPPLFFFMPPLRPHCVQHKSPSLSSSCLLTNFFLSSFSLCCPALGKFLLYVFFSPLKKTKSSNLSHQNFSKDWQQLPPIKQASLSSCCPALSSLCSTIQLNSQQAKWTPACFSSPQHRTVPSVYFF